ncbi:DUF397 domain-containing protein [Amycolatopsis palatopharyngis]|uniref:DUF397 domain-containing protein n=1 Tax=Amycolatopsis palatopharyngis TaxID=187982 RepID=UPI000E260080|nr:DUF397 domain-containing protein [Amycolatopsis palatopharyngis]
MTVQRLPTNWRKSRASSTNTDCVEVANNHAVALVRDTKSRNSGMLTVPAAGWNAFLDNVRLREQ